MSELKLDASNNLNIKYIADQGAHLLDLHNRLDVAVANKEAAKQAEQFLDQLTEYKYSHLEDEEKMLEENNHADLAAYKSSHRKFENKLDNFKIDHYYHKKDIGEGLLKFVQSLLKNHMSEEGQGFAKAFAGM